MSSAGRPDPDAPVVYATVQRSAAVRYAAAVLAVFVALALRQLLFGRATHESPFLVLFGAALFAAWFGGRGPARLAIVLSATAAAAFLLPWSGPSRTSSAIRLVVYVAEASAVAAFAVAVESARARAEASAEHRRRVDVQLRKANRAYRALAAANEIVVRGSDEGAMLKEICRALVDLAGYRMCWIGYAEHDEAKTVRPIAHAGYESGYLEDAHVSWSRESDRGLGPTGTAIRTGRPCVLKDASTNPAFAPWREDALARGYSSSMAVPLVVDAEVIGALMIYAAEADAFDEQEVRLVVDLANDVGYGISALRARQVAEKASRARDEFLRVVTHELRTPLTPLIGWAQLLKLGASRDPLRLAHGLDVILKCARTQANLVDEVLDASTFAAGEARLSLATVTFGALVRACVDEIRAPAEEKGVSLDVSLATDSKLVGDAERLLQAVRNVLSNALKFTPRGGDISIVLARDEDELTLRVRDTGKGIAPGDLAHVFERFRSGDASTTRTEGGLGAGLFVVRAIIEAHAGSIHVESAGEGRGTTITVKLPAARVARTGT
jgi:signal transduction histidine kinase